VALATLAFFVGAFWFANLMFAPMSTAEKPQPLRVNIPSGATADQIATKLKEAGLIRSGIAFIAAARLMGETGDMKAGEYLISPNKGVFQIIDQLVAGNAEAQWVVIPEGLTLGRIARMLEQRRLVSADQFIRAAHRKPKFLGLNIPVSRRSVEGYLMPDTYKFPRQISERALIREMLKNWNKKVLRPNAQLFARSDLPMDKIMVVASMIEREARVDADRTLISAVIRNRLKKKMPLQIDATVIYALGSHKDQLSFKDLKVKHPYNTYQNVGLPPGPICNPGIKAIEAALKPASEDYLYYVAQPDGSHIFTRTYPEHLAAIKKVKQMRAASAKT